MVPPELDGCVDMNLRGLCCSKEDKMQPDNRGKNAGSLSVSLREELAVVGQLWAAELKKLN